MRPAPARFPVLARPSRRALAAGLLAVLAGLLAHGLVTRARQEAAAWGPGVPAWVATVDLDAGDVLAPGDAVLVDRPGAAVPGAAVGDDPTGRTATAALAAGEVVLATRLAGPGATGPGALVPDGWRAVAVAQHDGVLPLEPGDVVDVVAALGPGAGSGGGGAVVVAAGAVVVHVAEDATVAVAVPAGAVPRLAAALVSGVVRLALVR